MSLERIDIDENQFAIRGTAFSAVREYLPDGRRGNWVLYMNGPLGELIVDKDQYSNDLLERVELHVRGAHSLNAGHYYGHRFKLNMPKGEFLERSATLIADAEFFFGGEWKAEYFDWDRQAVFSRVGGRLPEATTGTPEARAWWANR